MQNINIHVFSCYNPDDDNFTLLQPIITDEIIVPVGFISDGFSVPPALRSFQGRVGKGWYAAWVHDYCYYIGNEKYGRKWADKLFYKNLIRSGVSKFKARSMYYAVRACGGKYYKKKNITNAVENIDAE